MAFRAYPCVDGIDRRGASVRFTNNWVMANHRFLRE
jgi:hypothetical protein